MGHIFHYIDIWYTNKLGEPSANMCYISSRCLTHFDIITLFSLWLVWQRFLCTLPIALNFLLMATVHWGTSADWAHTFAIKLRTIRSQWTVAIKKKFPSSSPYLDLFLHQPEHYFSLAKCIEMRFSIHNCVVVQIRAITKEHALL